MKTSAVIILLHQNKLVQTLKGPKTGKIAAEADLCLATSCVDAYKGNELWLEKLTTEQCQLDTQPTTVSPATAAGW